MTATTYAAPTLAEAKAQAMQAAAARPFLRMISRQTPAGYAITIQWRE